MSSLVLCKPFAFVHLCVEERSFLVGNFSRKFDSWMVAICLFNKLRDLVLFTFQIANISSIYLSRLVV